MVGESAGMRSLTDMGLALCANRRWPEGRS
jgi:hypothetical protein